MSKTEKHSGERNELREMAEGCDDEGQSQTEGRDGEGQKIEGDTVSGNHATTARQDCNHNKFIDLNTSDITGGLETCQQFRWLFGQMLSTYDQLQEKYDA
ncbi:unnamed protein product [Camellia sinensis]